jgi:enterochelin esterase-like enzyme
MRHTFSLTVGPALLALSGVTGISQDNAAKKHQAQALTTAPEGFDAKRDGIERGELETIGYNSTTVGAKRKTQVYTPPGYSEAMSTNGRGAVWPT